MAAAYPDIPKTKKPFKVVEMGNAVVKIYRREIGRELKRGKRTYTVFEVSDYSTGSRRLRSFSNEAKARKEAETIARKLSAGDVRAAQIDSRDAAALGHSMQLLRPTGIPLLTAVTRVVEAVKILGDDRIIEACKDFARRHPLKRKPRKIRAVADELIALKTKRNKSERYLEDLRNRLDAFSGAFAVDVTRVTTADVQGWLDRMKAAPRTVKNFRDTANTLFKYAETRGYIARGENPVIATERVEVRNEEPIEIYSPEELHRLLAAARGWFKPLIALQAFAGLRSAELLRLDWRDVKLDRGHIVVPAVKAKTASRRLAPITANLAKWLKGSAKDSGKMFRHSRAYFHEVQRDTATGTEVRPDAKKRIEAIKPVEWKHNALRHSFISYRVADTNNVPQVALESGNSPAMIFANYRELVTPADAKAWFAMAPEAQK